MGNHRQEYLSYLLERRKWTVDEKEWLLDYLETGEISELKGLAAEEFENDLDSFTSASEPGMSEELLNKIHQRIKIPRPSFLQVVRLNWMRISVAASVILLVGMGYMLSGNSDSLFPFMSMRQVVTGAKERKTVKLPDGSLISLEPGTELKYPRRFSGATREVYINGEAFFEVTSDTVHPFIIHTEHINTTVLGTSFNVEANDSKESRVVVVTGRVKVQSEAGKKQTVVLTPNQSVVYQKGTGELQLEEAQDDAVFYRQKRAGKFVYKGVALNKVVDDLQRFYGTYVTIEESVKTCSFYGGFSVGEKLDKVLNIIALSLNATIKKDNDKGYLIVGGSCE